MTWVCILRSRSIPIRVGILQSVIHHDDRGCNFKSFTVMKENLVTWHFDHSGTYRHHSCILLALLSITPIGHYRQR